MFPEEQWHFVTDCATETGIVVELYLLLMFVGPCIIVITEE